MTVEVLLLILLAAAAAAAAGLGALLLAALGPAGWLVILALVVTAAFALRFAADRADWPGDDLRDDGRAG